MREDHGWTQRQLGEKTGREDQAATMWASRIELETTKPERLSVLELFQLAWHLRVSPWALITGWEPDELVDLGIDGVDPMPARMIWAWANWDESTFNRFLEDVEDQDFWNRYSPWGDGDPYEPTEIERLADELADEIITTEVRKALGKPRRVLTDEGEYEVSYFIDEETERGLRERLAAVINEKRDKR
jgi:hypothetical protein